MIEYVHLYRLFISERQLAGFMQLWPIEPQAVMVVVISMENVAYSCFPIPRTCRPRPIHPWFTCTRDEYIFSVQWSTSIHDRYMLDCMNGHTHITTYSAWHIPFRQTYTEASELTTESKYTDHYRGHCSRLREQSSSEARGLSPTMN
jgi:hypothetical protein